jgi:hypothetical protein
MSKPNKNTTILKKKAENDKNEFNKAGKAKSIED